MSSARPHAAPPRTRRRASEIIDAAARVFAERGYHGASTQDIADVLGIRQASLYYYFGSKEEALEQVCMLGVEGFVERAAEIAAGPGSAAARIRALVAAHLAPLGDRRDYVRVFLRERGNLPDVSRRRVGRLSRRLERLIEATFVQSWLPSAQGTVIDDVATAYAALLLDGVRTARPRRAR
jgi:AcrR family transcriptional regulator